MSKNKQSVSKPAVAENDPVNNNANPSSRVHGGPAHTSGGNPGQSTGLPNETSGGNPASIVSGGNPGQSDPLMQNELAEEAREILEAHQLDRDRQIAATMAEQLAPVDHAPHAKPHVGAHEPTKK